jgi:hypothetical protein
MVGAGVGWLIPDRSLSATRVVASIEQSLDEARVAHGSGHQPGGHRLLFYLVVTPTGFLFRLLGKDPLRLALDAGVGSYWIERRPPGPLPETMSNQF